VKAFQSWSNTQPKALAAEPELDTALRLLAFPCCEWHRIMKQSLELAPYVHSHN